VFECLAGDYEAGARQNSTAVSKDYGFIAFPGNAEIIPIYNQAAGFHLLRLPKANVKFTRPNWPANAKLSR